ncbi:MAG TPA: hypothetical protein VEA16_23460 [Vicinamibacterales bacterium]|nr:hypothetical protein [Vicinamibacterales bacterium]
MSSASADLKPSNRWLYIALAVLATTSIMVQVQRDRLWSPFVPESPPLWIQSGAVMQRLSLGYRNLLADIYWIRAVVYFGRSRLETPGAAPRDNFEQLYPLLDIVTQLDPRFRMAYRFGAVFLSEPPPGGPGRPDLAIALLQRAIEHGDVKWEYMEDLGFVYYWWYKDYTKAAEWFARAGQEPGAPNWLAPLAATTLAEGGDRHSARQLFQHLADTAEHEWVRKQAARRLLQLTAMDQIDEMNRRAERVRAGRTTAWKSWDEYLEANRMLGIPVDPSGTPYYLDFGTGLIGLDPQSSLWPLPK